MGDIFCNDPQNIQHIQITLYALKQALTLFITHTNSFAARNIGFLSASGENRQEGLQCIYGLKETIIAGSSETAQTCRKVLRQMRNLILARNGKEDETTHIEVQSALSKWRNNLIGKTHQYE
jgi:hypothetical protein